MELSFQHHAGRGQPEVPVYWPSRQTVDYLTKHVPNG